LRVEAACQYKRVRVSPLPREPSGVLVGGTGVSVGGAGVSVGGMGYQSVGQEYLWVERGCRLAAERGCP